jgi:hypothetical protein
MLTQMTRKHSAKAFAIAGPEPKSREYFGKPMRYRRFWSSRWRQSLPFRQELPGGSLTAAAHCAAAVGSYSKV